MGFNSGFKGLNQVALKSTVLYWPSGVYSSPLLYLVTQTDQGTETS